MLRIKRRHHNLVIAFREQEPLFSRPLLLGSLGALLFHLSLLLTCRIVTSNLEQAPLLPSIQVETFIKPTHCIALSTPYVFHTSECPALPHSLVDLPTPFIERDFPCAAPLYFSEESIAYECLEIDFDNDRD